MAKRNKAAKKEALVPSEATALVHNPLAALAAFRDGAAPSRSDDPGPASTQAKAPSAGPTTKSAGPVPARGAPGASPTSERASAKAPAPKASASANAAPKAAATTLHGSGPIRFADKIVVRRETKGRAGKTVTRVSGIPAKDLQSLAKEMKKAMGCGATVEDADLLLLGSLVDRAADWLLKAGAAKVVKGN